MDQGFAPGRDQNSDGSLLCLHPGGETLQGALILPKLSAALINFGIVAIVVFLLSFKIEHASVFGVARTRSYKCTRVTKRGAFGFLAVSITCVLMWIVETVAGMRLVSFLRHAKRKRAQSVSAIARNLKESAQPQKRMRQC